MAAVDEITVGENWVEGWISVPVIDRSNEYVPVEEWDTSEHERNPIALVKHDLKGEIVGKWEHPDGQYSIEKRANGLFGRCYFDMGSEAGRNEYRQYKLGFKRGFSPGFTANKPVKKYINGKPVDVLTGAKLFEVSLVNIPDNPEALAVRAKSQTEAGKNDLTPSAEGGRIVRYGASVVKKKESHKPSEEMEKPADEVAEKLKAMYGRWKEMYPEGDVELLEKQLMDACKPSEVKAKEIEDEEEIEEPGEVEETSEVETEVEEENPSAITPENLRAIVAEIAQEVLGEHLSEVIDRISGHEEAIGALTETLEAMAENPAN